MRTYYYFILVVTFFASCNKNNGMNNYIEDDESVIFSVSYSGGWSSVDESLKINAKATHYSSSYYDIKTKKRKSYQTTIKTPDKQWEYLTQIFDLETFKKINEGPCRSCVDGVDEKFSVTIDGITYSFYNGVIDENYLQMQDFFDKIHEQIEIFRNNAVYK
jgi:hypothetical protein